MNLSLAKRLGRHVVLKSSQARLLQKIPPEAGDFLRRSGSRTYLEYTLLGIPPKSLSWRWCSFSPFVGKRYRSLDLVSPWKNSYGSSSSPWNMSRRFKKTQACFIALASGSVSPHSRFEKDVLLLTCHMTYMIHPYQWCFTFYIYPFGWV